MHKTYKSMVKLTWLSLLHVKLIRLPWVTSLELYLIDSMELKRNRKFKSLRPPAIQNVQEHNIV